MLEPTRRPVLSHKVVPRQKIKLGVSDGRFGVSSGRFGVSVGRFGVSGGRFSAGVGRLVCVCVGSALFWC